MVKIKIADLVPNTYNPRKLFKSASMEELKNSIEQHGLIEPLVIRKKGQKYEVVAGMRRYYALKELGTTEVECNILELNDTEAIDISFLENIQRDNLTPIEEARMYYTRLLTLGGFEKKYGKSVILRISDGSKFLQQLKEIYNRDSPATIRNKLSLLNLPETMQTGIEHNELPQYFGYEIARLSTIEDYDVAQDYMLQIYEDYRKDKDSFSLEIIRDRVNKKIEFEKEKETAQEKLSEQRKEEIEKEIVKITEARTSEINKLIELNNDVFNEDGLEPDESYQITEIEDEEILEKAENLQEFLEAENLKYQDDTLYEDVVNEITKLESDITDMKLLIKRAREHDLPRCPYCRAGINIKYIVKDIKIFSDDLDNLRKERGSISGKKSFIYDKLTRVQRLITSVTTKDEAINTLESELETLG